MRRRVLAEFLGTMGLVAVVVGSGIAAERLSPDDVGLQLLENAIATGAGLAALILTFGPVSGAHFNPVVTLAARLPGREAAAYIGAQVTGAIAGSIVANAMYEEPLVAFSEKSRSGTGLWIAEVVATVGLVLLIGTLTRTGGTAVAPWAVGAYIASAYFFTASTSFANPAVTIGRAFTATFAGIEPSSVPAFIVCQLAGAALAVALTKVLHDEHA